MKLKLKKKMSERVVARLKNKVRIRKKVEGTSERPRLSVFRSGQHIYAQLVDDVNRRTLVAASSQKIADRNGPANRDVAFKVGQAIAQAAKQSSIESVVFDRSGYIYHGRVKALAEGAREAGLKF